MTEEKVNKTIKEEIKEFFRFLFSWKYWLASFIVIAINAVIAGVVLAIWYFSGGIVTKDAVFLSWITAIFSCVIWIMLIEGSKKK